MSANNKTPKPASSGRRQARRLKIIGVVVLLLGIGGAGALYWLRTRAPDLSDDPSMAGYNRPEMRQMGQLYGKSGLMIEEWSDDLKQPGTQAIIIIGFSGLVAACCFYFARLLDDDETG